MKAKTKITKEDLMKMNKSAHRKALIGAGLYNIHKNRTFKTKKDYSRKDKHKSSLTNI
jgi:hypothetical protein